MWGALLLTFYSSLFCMTINPNISGSICLKDEITFLSCCDSMIMQKEEAKMCLKRSNWIIKKHFVLNDLPTRDFPEMSK